MSRILQFALATAAISVTAFFGLGTYLLWESRSIPLRMNGVLARAEGVESKANATLINLDKGTAAWASSSAGQAQAVQNVMTDLRGTISSINQTLTSLQMDANAIQGTVSSAQGTADAAKHTLDALTVSIQTANDTIAAGKPLLEAYTRSGDDLDALLHDEAIHRTLSSTADTMTDLHSIIYDGSRVTHKMTEDFLRPVPWWKLPVKRVGQLWDISAAFARHTP
jgi:hypothetical protein